MYHAAKTNDDDDLIPFPEDYRHRAPGRLRVWASDVSGCLVRVLERGDLRFRRTPAIGMESVLRDILRRRRRELGADRGVLMASHESTDSSACGPLSLQRLPANSHRTASGGARHTQR